MIQKSTNADPHHYLPSRGVRILVCTVGLVVHGRSG